MGAIADAIVAYAQPLLDSTDGSTEELEKAFAVAQICYNLSLAPEDSREEQLHIMQQGLMMESEEFAVYRSSVIDPMIQRHEQMFPGLHRRKSGGPLSDIATSRPHSVTAKAVERQTTTDRYAPCPCNSGKKYKFCCGMKSRG